MDRFYELAREEHKIRIKNENIMKENKINNGEYIYIDYCLWCNAFNNGKFKEDYKKFIEYIKDNNIQVNFWQFKKISEKYFNFFYKYDSANKKWNIKRKIN